MRCTYLMVAVVSCFCCYYYFRCFFVYFSVHLAALLFCMLRCCSCRYLFSLFFRFLCCTLFLFRTRTLSVFCFFLIILFSIYCLLLAHTRFVLLASFVCVFTFTGKFYIKRKWLKERISLAACTQYCFCCIFFFCNFCFYAESTVGPLLYFFKHSMNRATLRRLPCAASVKNQLNCDVMARPPLRRDSDTVTGEREIERVETRAPK